MMLDNSVGTGRKPFFGWIIVGVALITLAFWFGIRSTFSVFFVAMVGEFGWGRGAAAGVQSLSLVVYSVFAPLVGGLIDRFGPRKVILPGIIVLAAGLAACSLIRSLGSFYLIYGLLVGMGVTGIAIVAYGAVLSHWFIEKRGLASGIAVSGMGFGIMFFVPLIQYFVLHWGWRQGFMVLSVLALAVLLPINLIFLRHKPGDIGLFPDGRPPSHAGSKTTATARSGPVRDWTLSAAAGTINFWALLAFPALVMIAIYIVVVHLVGFLVDEGVDPMTAASALAMLGMISSVFRIFWGWLSDRIGRELAYTLSMIPFCLGLFCLIRFEHSSSMWLVYAFVLLFGLGWGATAPMFMASAADLFQGRVIGLIYGFLEGSLGLGAALGSWVAGYIFDNFKSYHYAFFLAIGAGILSCVFIWIASPRHGKRTFSQSCQ